jgi:hypothetical protein
MSGLVEDIDEALGEAEDEEIEEALGEDEWAERRRRRRPRGRGYTPVRYERGSGADLRTATSRIGQDIRTLNTTDKALEAKLDRYRRDTAQSMQMMALLPLLIKPKSIALNAAVANMPTGTKVMVDEQDTLTALLPLFFLGGFGGGFGGQAAAAPGAAYAGGVDPMMMVLLMFVLLDSRKTGTP